MAQQSVGEDFALERVPEGKRYGWLAVTVMRFGQLSALSQFLLGATLGYGMSFWNAFWALTLGAVILEIVSIIVGIAGQREGLSTPLLARWAGFGRYGSSLIGLIIAIGLIGWFGIQNAVFASGLQQLLGILPLWAWSIVTGAIVVVIVVYGFLSMGWTAYLAVPLFLLVAAVSIVEGLSHHTFGHLVAMAPPGHLLTLTAGTTLVAGGFIIGAVITPDMTRYNRTPGDVIKQTLIGITLGEYTIGLIGVLLAHAVRSSNVITIVMSTSGLIGTIVLVTATLKINDWNLYSSSLGVVNLIDAVFGKKVSRARATWVIGGLGTLMAAAGILQHFVGFLIALGVTIPPISGIMIVDYWILRRSRVVLDNTRRTGTLPERMEAFNWIMVATWLLSSLLGYYVPWGVQSLNSLIAAMVLYWVLMKAAGLAKLPGYTTETAL